MLIANFNDTFFLKRLEVLKLEQKTKLSSADGERKFLDSLMSVDFNNRNEESEFK